MTYDHLVTLMSRAGGDLIVHGWHLGPLIPQTGVPGAAQFVTPICIMTGSCYAQRISTTHIVRVGIPPIVANLHIIGLHPCNHVLSNGLFEL
jgi:hypothetical protein